MVTDCPYSNKMSRPEMAASNHMSWAQMGVLAELVKGQEELACNSRLAELVKRQEEFACNGGLAELVKGQEELACNGVVFHENIAATS